MVLTGVAVLLLVVGVVVFLRSRQAVSGNAHSVDNGVKAAEYPVLIPGLCRARSAAAAGADADARNVFYGRSHYALHVLVADVLPLDRRLAGSIQQAKATVEQDLSTSAPGLATHLGSLISLAADALNAVGAGDVPLVCAP